MFFMKKGDVVGLISLLLIMGVMATIFAFAPKTPEISFQPIEIPGSSLALLDLSNQGVVVDATLMEKGFVTLHGSIGGAPGPIVGTSDILDVGTHSSLLISSTQELSSSNEYVMLLIADDGDGIYEAGVDRPVMVNGEVIKIPVVFASSGDLKTKE